MVRVTVKTLYTTFGVRQGSVLSPFLFALYIDDLGKLCNSQTGCFIILYADDILLISPSVVYLEQLLHGHWSLESGYLTTLYSCDDCQRRVPISCVRRQASDP